MASSSCGAIPKRRLETAVSETFYMVMTGLAWNLKAWSGLLMPDRRRETEVVKMESRSFLQKILQVPAQIIKAGDKILFSFSNRRHVNDLF